MASKNRAVQKPKHSHVRGLGDSLGDPLGLPIHATDAVVNAMTGTGTSRSKSTYNRHAAAPDLDPGTLELLFRDNAIARRIVTKLVDTALRAGFQIRRADSSPKSDASDAKKILNKFNKLNGPKMLSRAAKWGRLFGGGGLILAASGSGRLDDEFVDEKTKRLERVIEWDLQQLTEIRWYPDGEPSHYLFTPNRRGGSTGPMVVHASRVIPFPGAEATITERNQNQGWDDSVLQAVYETLLDYDGTWASITDMFADASQAVFKLSGLIEALAEGNGDGVRDVMTRLRTMDITRSSSRALVLDAGDENGKGGEEFDTIDRTGFGTLAPMVIQLFVRLCAAADMPMTVLLGTSPSGADATGESDLALWFNSVDVYRQQLTPIVSRLVHIIAREVGDSDPESWEVVWPELQRPNPLDVATARNMTVTSLVQLIQNEVSTPEEGALALPRMMEEGLSGLELDVASRKFALKEALKDIRERAYAEEPEPAVPPAPDEDGDEETEGEPEEPPKGGPGNVQPPPERKSKRKTPAKAAGRQT